MTPLINAVSVIMLAASVLLVLLSVLIERLRSSGDEVVPAPGTSQIGS